MTDTPSSVILIVEDEAPLRRILGEKLQREGFAVLEAPNGNDGLKLALDKHPNLILLDLIMPGKSGVEMLEELRADKWGAEVPVLVLTNVDDNAQILKAVQHKASYYMKSDWTLEALIEEIKKTLTK